MAARKARPAARLAAAFVAASLSACSVADQLAGHSLEYNIQAERVKNQNLLVNIVRAAYRRPLQFTDLTTITGQTGIRATGGLQLPFAGPMAADTTRLFVFNPSIQATNSPSYTVAVLNTKEFYQGILTPIPMQTIAYYIRTGFPKSVLLALAISEIEYGHAGHTKRVDNIPAKPEFSQLLGTLIAFGLNVEEADATTVVGDPFGDKDYPAPKVIADLDGQGIQVVRHGIDEPGSALTAAQKAQFRAAGHYFQLEKTSAPLLLRSELCGAQLSWSPPAYPSATRGRLFRRARWGGRPPRRRRPRRDGPRPASIRLAAPSLPSPQPARTLPKFSASGSGPPKE